MNKSIVSIAMAMAMTPIYGNDREAEFKKVQPILQERCISCHAAPYESRGRLRNPKGDYRVDSRENILKAGESKKPGVVPTAPEKSYLYTLITLPPDDDDIMPAKGDALTASQREAIKNWITGGAYWPEGVVLKRPVK